MPQCFTAHTLQQGQCDESILLAARRDGVERLTLSTLSFSSSYRSRFASSSFCSCTAAATTPRSAATVPDGKHCTSGGSWRPAAERRSAEAVCVGHDYIPRTLVTAGRRDNAGRRGQSLEAPLRSSLGDGGRCQDSGSDGYWIITGRPRHRRERRSARVRRLGFGPAARPCGKSRTTHDGVCDWPFATSRERLLGPE